MTRIGDFDLPKLPDGVHAAVATPAQIGDHSLHPEEWKSLGESATGRRRLDFQLGRVAAHRALEALGMTEHVVLRGPSGEPIWPRGVVGSITHSTELALAIVARLSDASGLGIDLEHRRPAGEIEPLIAFDDERDWLSGSEPNSEGDRLLELFAAKEAVFKAFYPRVGRFFGFEAVRLRPEGGDSFSVAFVDESVVPQDDGSSRVQIQWRDERVLACIALPPESRPASGPSGYAHGDE